MIVKLARRRKEDSLKELHLRLTSEDFAGFHPGLDAVVKIMSKDEIDALLRVTYKATALYYLNETREDSKVCEINSSIKKMYHFLEKGKFSIEDIGTSDNELQRMERTGYLSAAKGYLERARRRNRHSDMNVKFCLKSLAKTGLSLDALGIKEEEMEELLKKSN